MGFIIEGLLEGIKLIVRADSEVFALVAFTLKVCLVGTFLASLIGIPLGFIIGTRDFSGRNTVITVFQTLTALPTVLVGLLGYGLVCRRGPFGSFGLLFTPSAIIFGQWILATPLITALSISTFRAVHPQTKLLAMAMGGNPWQVAKAIFIESRFMLTAVILAGFGRVISEVGSAMILGGNIRGYTRTITTAIALETGKGEFGMAIALGMILMLIALSFNAIFFHFFQKTG